MKKKFAIINPWPGAKNAEHEILERIKLGAKQINCEAIVIDGNGFILNNEQLRTANILDTKNVDFVISTHFTTPKFLDSFHYMLMWNPAPFLFEYSDYSELMDNYRMFDSHISHDSFGIIDHANAILKNTDKEVNQDIAFYPSASEKLLLIPNLDNPKIFYCAINWEKYGNRPKRHGNILKSLDSSNIAKIYGLDYINGDFMWNGFNNYNGCIPFDGISVINKINQCGISLCLSSEAHRKNAAMSNRLYESIAAGAIIISDNNAFVKKHFGDCILYFDYEPYDEENAFKQIQEKYNWIINNKKEAIEKIKRSQEIFREKFSMEKQIENLFKCHEKNKAKIFLKEHSLKTDETIDILLRWNYENSMNFDFAIKNINTQLYQNINLILVCDTEIKDELEEKIKLILKKNISYKIIEIGLFNRKIPTDQVGYRKYSTGEMLEIAKPYLINKYTSFLKCNEIWFKDHLSSLKRTLENNPERNLAYSGLFIKFADLRMEKIFFNKLTIQFLENNDHKFTDSQILVKRDFINKFTAGLLTYIDYSELYLLGFDSYLNNSAYFSKKMTCGIFADKVYEKNLFAKLICNHAEQKRMILDIYKYNDKLENFINNRNSSDKELFKHNLLSVLRNDLLKKRRIPRIIAKIFFGKRNWAAFGSKNR